MEDFDLALRLRSAGWRTVVAADAVGVHLGSATHGHRSAWQRRHGGFGRGYVLRRYGVLRGRTAPRTLVTEAVVVLGDLAISRDLAALRGRLAGWRAAPGARGWRAAGRGDRLGALASATRSRCGEGCMAGAPPDLSTAHRRHAEIAPTGTGTPGGRGAVHQRRSGRRGDGGARHPLLGAGAHDARTRGDDRPRWQPSRVEARRGAHGRLPAARAGRRCGR